MILISSLTVSATEIRFPNYYSLEKSGQSYNFFRADERTEKKYLYAFDAEGMMLIASINTAYLGLLDIQAEHLELIQSLEEETGFLETELQLEKKTIAEYKLLYEVTEIEKQEAQDQLNHLSKKFSRAERKNKLRLILLSGGTGIGCLAVGLLIGSFLL